MPPSTLPSGSAPSKGRPISSAVPGCAHQQGCRCPQRRQPLSVRIPDASGRPVRTDLSRRGAALSRRHRAADCDHRPHPFWRTPPDRTVSSMGAAPGPGRLHQRGSRQATISSAIFGVFRHERNGLVDERARRQMRLIAPHIRRAVLISRMFEFKAGEVATFIDALDGLSAGCISSSPTGASIMPMSPAAPASPSRYPAFRGGGWDLRCTGPTDASGSLRPRPGDAAVGSRNRSVADQSGRRALRRPCPTVDVRRASPRRHK